MNRLTLFAFAIALLVVAAYFALAARRNKKVDLATVVNIFISTIAVQGGIRLVAFALSDQFRKAILSINVDSIWSLTPEDGVFVAVGGLALIWIALQSILQSFVNLRERDV